MNPRHLWRLALWLRRPPSARRVLLVFAVISLALLVAAVDHLGLWPDWARASAPPRPI